MTGGVLQQGGRAQVSEPLAAPPPHPGMEVELAGIQVFL